MLSRWPFGGYGGHNWKDNKNHTFNPNWKPQNQDKNWHWHPWDKTNWHDNSVPSQTQNYQAWHKDGPPQHHDWYKSNDQNVNWQPAQRTAGTTQPNVNWQTKNVPNQSYYNSR